MKRSPRAKQTPLCEAFRRSNKSVSLSAAAAEQTEIDLWLSHSIFGATKIQTNAQGQKGKEQKTRRRDVDTGEDTWGGG